MDEGGEMRKTKTGDFGGIRKSVEAREDDIEENREYASDLRGPRERN